MGDLLRSDDATEQGAGRPPFLDKPRLLLVAAEPGVDIIPHREDTVAHRRTREDAVDRDPRSGESLRESPRGRQLRGLGHAIMHHVGRRLHTSLAGDEDHPAVVAFGHPRGVAPREADAR